MKVLLTGASSFTGYWFARELHAAGHEVVAALRAEPERYEGVRRARVDLLSKHAKLATGISFGDDAFLAQIGAHERWDLLCHHAADVTNYKSEDFDVDAAVASNTRNLRKVLAALGAKSCRKMIVTGSVFEQDEGAGSDGLPAFSPYGLSKGLTAQVARYHALKEGFALGKFVIANPFGRYEEPRFTSYLARTWFAGEVARVQTPDYIRDNIHVELLAKAYAAFAGELPAASGVYRLGPSGYPGSQGDFTSRVAAAMRPRLGLDCKVALQQQKDFPEPRMRVNTDFVDADKLGFDEEKAWDDLAEYYRESFGS